MLKRILTIALGVMAGAVLSVGAAHFASLWGWLPGSELDHSTNTLHDVLKLVNDNYVAAQPAALPQLTRAALDGMINTLDPHSAYMDPAERKALEEDISSEFGGIGVQVELVRDRIVVVAPVAGSPGERAGIQRGDEITGIDGEKLPHPSMEDIVSHLRGKPGTKVTVGILRPATGKEVSFVLTRESIRVESVRDAHLLGDGIGYLELTEFGEHTADEFAVAVKQLKAQGLRALVIDLRNNPGGLLDSVVDVASTFFNKKELVVYTQGRDPKDREDYLADPTGPPLTIPLAVLINAGSASAAEILTGALKDTHRAVIVGERSFGKGSVQSIYDLDNGGGLRLTVARYYTPGGEVIHEHGVSPDVEVVATPEEDRSLLLQRARSDLTDPRAFKARFGVDLVPDRQLDAAVAVLRSDLLLDTRVAAAKKP